MEVNATKKVALVKNNATGTSGPSLFFFSSRICQYLRTELFCACHSQTFTSAVVLANRLSKCLADGEQPVVQNCKEITSCPAPPKTLPKGLTAATRTIVLLPHIQPCTPTHTLANFSPALYRGRPLISGCLSTLHLSSLAHPPTHAFTKAAGGATTAAAGTTSAAAGSTTAAAGTPPHPTLPHLTSPHLTSPDSTQPHRTPRHLTSPHVISSRLT